MNTIDIKHRVTNSIIGFYKCEDNTPIKTLQHLVKHRVNLAYADLRGMDLAFGRFDHLDFRHCDLREADITGANFNYSNLYGSNLSNVIGKYSSFQSAHLHRVCAKNADFTRSIFLDAQCMEGTFNNSNFSKAVLINFITRGTTFKGCNTEGAYLDPTDTRIGKQATPYKVTKCSDHPCDPGCTQACRSLQV